MKKIIISAFAAIMAFLPVGNVMAATDVQLLSPKGGEKYSVGQTVIVRWTSSLPEDATVSASLMKLKGDEWTPGNSYEQVENSYLVNLTSTENTGSSSWRVTYDIPAGNYALQLDIYHNDKYSNQYTTLYSQKLFQISNSEATNKNAPKISSVIHDSVEQGSEVTVSGTNFKTDNRVFIKALGADSYGTMEMMVTKSSKKSTTFRIDQYITPGNYELHIENTNGISAKAPLIVIAPAVSPFPFITSANPVSGLEGTTITVNGGNFTDKNDINYYSNDFPVYPIEDGKGDSESEDDSDKLMYPAPGYMTEVKSTDGKTLQFKLPKEAYPGTYSINISNTKGYSDAGYFTLVNPDIDAAHPSGSNVLGPDGAIYFVNSGTRTPYPSAAVLHSDLTTSPLWAA